MRGGIGKLSGTGNSKKLIKGQDLKNAPLPTYTRETDLFALAVHVFSLLMNGCHPFACAKQTSTGYENTMEAINDTDYESVVLPQPIENIKDGFFPFYQKREGVTYPLYAPDFNAFPEDIRRFFVRAFVDGYVNPYGRPTAEEWLLLLKKYRESGSTYNCGRGHYYFINNQKQCPYCNANNRMFALMKNSSVRLTPPQARPGGQYAVTTHPVTNMQSMNGMRPIPGNQPKARVSSNINMNGRNPATPPKSKMTTKEIVAVTLAFTAAGIVLLFIIVCILYYLFGDIYV